MTTTRGRRPSAIDLELARSAVSSRRAQRELIDRLEEVSPEDLQETLAAWPVGDLQFAGSGLIQFHARLEETKADVLKALAKVVVALRAHFRTPDGVDWSGRSWEYRQAVGAMYEAAGVPPDSQSNIQASLRYHVGNILREAVPPKELEAVGLRTDSPKERMNLARQRALALAEAFEDAEAPQRTGRHAGRRAESLVRNLKTVHLIVQSLPRNVDISGLTKSERRTVVRAIDGAEKALQALRESVESAGADG